MRRAAAWAVAASIAAACAQPGIPPGGPPDKEAPVLAATSPDTNALNVRARSVVLRFDEVVDERSTPAGGGARVSVGSLGGNSASTIGSLVLLSPGDGRERVTWRRTAIEIEPRGGFRANTTYRLTLLPGLRDLRGNVLREQIDVVFSTGAARTTGTVQGAIFDWVAGRPAALARVELFAPNDTMLRWHARADSAGRFTVRDLAPGRYRVRGWNDADGDREVDPREAFDSLTVAVDTAASVELYAFVHDTLGPRIEQLEALDSLAVRVRFDRGVATDWTPGTGTVVLMRADSSTVPVTDMIPFAVYDSLRKAARAAADSARGDTTQAADTTATPVPGVRTPPRISIIREGADARDTVPRRPPPTMSRPQPIQQWVIRPGTPLAPGDYRAKFEGVRGLTGAATKSEREFRLRPPAPPADTTKPAAAPPTRPPATPTGRP